MCPHHPGAGNCTGLTLKENVDPLQNTVGPSLKNGTCPERLAVAASSEVLDSVTEKTKRTYNI